MAAAESPLVPGQRARRRRPRSPSIPTARKRKLTLRKYHVDVHIEDGFARTTIDQTYFNHEHGRLEGTFYFPLPPDASLSRLAMYVDGKLMEGGMVERDHARDVYETHRLHAAATRPCWNGWTAAPSRCASSRWKARQEKRIVLSYTQRLPALYGRTQYRFPAGHSLDVVARLVVPRPRQGRRRAARWQPAHRTR